MGKRDYSSAFSAAVSGGVLFDQDYFQQGHAAQILLADLAKSFGYRKPKNANGSTSRYFFALLNRRRGDF